MTLPERMTCRVRVAMMPTDHGGSVRRRFGGVRFPRSIGALLVYKLIMPAFLTVPAYSFFLSLRNHAPLNRKETVSPCFLVVFHCRSHMSFIVLARRCLVHRLGVQPLHRYQVPQPKRYPGGRWRCRRRIRCQHVRSILQRQRLRRHGESCHRCSSASLTNRF